MATVCGDGCRKALLLTPLTPAPEQRRKRRVRATNEEARTCRAIVRKRMSSSSAPGRPGSRSPSSLAFVASALSLSSGMPAPARSRAPRPPMSARCSICDAGASPTSCVPPRHCRTTIRPTSCSRQGSSAARWPLSKTRLKAPSAATRVFPSPPNGCPNIRSRRSCASGSQRCRPLRFNSTPSLRTPISRQMQSTRPSAIWPTTSAAPSAPNI